LIVRKDAGRHRVSDRGHTTGARSMHALRDFFTTDYGLMSAAGIAFMLGMGVFFVRYFLTHIREDAAAAEREARLGR
jgi:hypothetical protein